MSIVIFHAMKNYWDFKISITKVEITNAMSTPSILTCKMTMVGIFLYFSASFYFLYEFLNLSPHIKQ